MTAYEKRKTALLSMLEAYRNTPPEAFKRVYIDELAEKSRNSIWDDEDKTLHNLAVLAYIADGQRAKSAICKALHIGRDNYEQKKRKAVERLCILAFGVDGIDWA